MNCAKCGSGNTEFKEGISKVGKPYAGYKCKACNEMNWVNKKKPAPTYQDRSEPTAQDIDDAFGGDPEVPIPHDKTWETHKKKFTTGAEIKKWVTPPAGEPKVDWDAKERRMVRMNALSHATDIVNAEHKEMFGATPAECSRAQMVCNAAEILEMWVYRKGV